MGDTMDTTRNARAARNQSLYREINERVKELNAAFDALPLGDWICECASEDCFDAIPMTHEEYEAVRAVPTRFFVVPDDAHVVPEAENVVERHQRYWVVEKIGVSAKLVERRDPRAASGNAG